MPLCVRLLTAVAIHGKEVANVNVRSALAAASCNIQQIAAPSIPCTGAYLIAATKSANYERLLKASAASESRVSNKEMASSKIIRVTAKEGSVAGLQACYVKTALQRLCRVGYGAEGILRRVQANNSKKLIGLTC